MKKHVKILYALICAAMMLTMIVGIHTVSAAGQLTVAVSAPATVAPGAEVNFDIDVSNNPGFSAISVGIIYPAGWSQTNIVNNVSHFNLTKGSTNVWDAESNYTANGKLATVTVKIPNDATPGKEYTITLVCEASDENFDLVPVTAVKAVITVECPHTNTENRPEIPAKCNQTGTAAGVYCLGCNTYISGGAPIPATGLHADADGKWETDGDNHWHTCSCGEVIDKAAHTGGTATCVAKAKCSICEVEYGSINADNHKKGELQKDADYHWYVCDNGCGNPIEKASHADSTKQVATEVYLKNPEATCTQKLEYYYACTVCEAKATTTWVSDIFGTTHTYDTYNDAKPEVHEKDKLEAGVAAHYVCACGKIFTEAKVEVTDPAALNGVAPKHDDIGGYKKDGEKHWKTCSVCGFEHTAENHAFANAEDMICDTCGHDRSCTHPEGLTFVAAVAPTCTVDGNVEHWVCDACSKTFDSAKQELKDVVAKAPGHNFATEFTFVNGTHYKECTAVDCDVVSEEAACSGGKATCQAGAVCAICQNTYTGIAVHDFATQYTTESGKHWRECQTAGCTAITNEADCSGGTATCYSLAVCGTCGKEYGELKAHVLSTTWEYKDATGHAYVCTNTGCVFRDTIQDHVDDDNNEKCIDCGYEYHTCGVDMTYFAPITGTCKVQGRYAYYKCSCNKLYYDEAATRVLNDIADIVYYGSHTLVIGPEIPATCTETGATESMVCSVCHTQFLISYVIPAIGHTWCDWTTTLEPTEYEEGSKTRKCSVCRAVETDSIPALGHEHTPVELPAVAPTATETGLTAGSKCATCEEILVAQEIIPALGEIVIETPAEEGEESSVIITGTGIAVGTKVEVTYKPAEEFANISVTVEGKQGSILQVADITLELEGNKVQPDGSVQVKLLINEALRTLENLEVVYIAADGTVEVMNAVREGNYLVFDAKHFSNYAVVELKEEVVTEPEETTQAPEETTAAPEETTAAPEETTAAPEETTAAPEETTAAPEETTAAPEETTQAPEDITVPEETTEAPVETTEAPEETTAAPEETTSPEVPSTGDNAIFFIVALIAFSAIFAVVVTISKKRNDN